MTARQSTKGHPLGDQRGEDYERRQVLETALRAIWWHGHRGVSNGDLAAAPGLDPPSRHVLFGVKRSLVDEVEHQYMKCLDDDLARDMSAPTAREAVARLLRSTAEQLDGPGTPPGWLVLHEPLLAERRLRRQRAIHLRLQRALITGELAPDVIRGLMAYIDTVVAGLAARAGEGAQREKLLHSACWSMGAWPVRVGQRGGLT